MFQQTFYESGELSSILTSLPNGSFYNKYYYKTGILEQEQFINKNDHEICKFYNSDGFLFRENSYINDIFEGLCKEYYPKSGKLKSEKMLKTAL